MIQRVADPGRRHARGFYGWRLVVALGIGTVISYGTTAYAFGVLLTPIATQEHWTRGSLSGAYSLGILVAGVVGVPIGGLVDRFGGRILMSAGSVLGGLVLIGLAQVHDVVWFDALWGGGLGLATALTFYPVSFTVLANWFHRRRGAALAWLTTIGGLASPVFIPLVGALVAHLGWRATVELLGLAQLGIALPLHALVLRRHPEDLGFRPDGASEPDQAVRIVEPSRPSSGASAGEAIRSVAFWTLTTGAGVDQLGGMVVSAHQISLMISRGVDPVLAAGIAGLIGLVSLPGRFLLNLLSDRWDRQRLLVAVLVVLGVGVVILTLAASLDALYGYAVVYGIAFGTRSPLRASVMAEHFGRRSYGAITALQGVMTAIPAALGPLAAGWLYDRLGSYELSFWLTAASFAVAALLVGITPKAREGVGGSERA